jgi:thiamine-phosphate pyrophosphorylase
VDVARERLGPDAVIGFSAHEEKEVTGPQAAHVDYFFFSPIFPTESKPGHPGTGIETLSRICAATEVPVFALGGITPARVGLCLEAGVQGVAVLSGILDAKDPARAAKAFLRAVASSDDR